MLSSKEEAEWFGAESFEAEDWEDENFKSQWINSINWRGPLKTTLEDGFYYPHCDSCGDSTGDVDMPIYTAKMQGFWCINCLLDFGLDPKKVSLDYEAESFEAEIPKDYRIYNPTGSGAGGFKIVSANFINYEDVVIEAELVEGEERFGVPNEFFKGVLSKVYDEYDAESFENETANIITDKLKIVDDETLVEVGNYFGISNNDMEELYDEILEAIKNSPSSYLTQLQVILEDESFEAENLKCSLCGTTDLKRIENDKGQVFYYCEKKDSPYGKCLTKGYYGTSAEGMWVMPDGMNYFGVVKYIDDPATVYLSNACPQCDQWFSVSDANTWKHCDNCYDDYDAESFEAETTIAKQYGETLDNLDDLQKIVKKTISPKRKPTKFIKDAKSSVVDSWKQMGKDGFRRQMYEPMEFEAEIPKSVKLGFGFGAGLALFQVAVIGSAIGLGMLLNKE